MLDAAKSFRDIYAEQSRNRQDVLERYADQLATLCSILGEYPSINPRMSLRMQSNWHTISSQVKRIQSRQPKTRRTIKDQTQLIIVDRGFDPVSPIIHELTTRQWSTICSRWMAMSFAIHQSTIRASSSKEVILGKFAFLFSKLGPIKFFKKF